MRWLAFADRICVSEVYGRGADHAGPREKLSATRSLSAPSVGKRLSADVTLVFRAMTHLADAVQSWQDSSVLAAEGGENIGEVELAEFRLRSRPCVLASWRSVQPPPKAIGLGRRLEAPDQERPNRSQCNNIELRLDRTPGHQDTRTRAGRKFNPPHQGRRGRLPYVRRIKRRREHANEIPPTPLPLHFPPHPGQRLVSRKAHSHGGSRERRVAESFSRGPA